MQLFSLCQHTRITILMNRYRHACMHAWLVSVEKSLCYTVAHRVTNNHTL